jgi:hypothetical protein
MLSIDDVFNEQKNVNMNSQIVRSELTQVKNTLKTGFSDILQNMQTLAYCIRELYKSNTWSYL